MKIVTLLLFLPFSLAAQSFTPPDTVLMRQQKVKELQVYYNCGSAKDVLQHTYHFDRRGRITDARESNYTAKYEYSWDDQNRETSTTLRNDDGSVTERWTTSYPAGKNYRVVMAYGSDTLHPNAEYHYQQPGDQPLYTGVFVDGKLFKVTEYTYESGIRTLVRDSFPVSQQAEIRRDGQLIRVSQYATPKAREQHELMQYENQLLVSLIDSVPGNPADHYLLQRDRFRHITAISCNGKALSASAQKEWLEAHRNVAHDYNMEDEDSRLPYSDPVPDMTETHQTEKNKSGLITSDKISTPGRPDALFRYVYRYY